jgi:very-short-patch-repair endonuclease
MASERARNLRKNLTDTERIVWFKLRSRRFENFKFRRQVPIGSYIVDFVCFEERLILELDGGQHAEQMEYDEKRTNWLNSQSFRVLRFWNNQVLEDWDVVEEVIWRELQKGATSLPLTPDPSPARGEGSKMGPTS